MERVRLMGWCRTCVPGAHLPAFAAAEGGLFAEQGIEVEFVGCAKAPDYTLQGFTARPKAVAAGDADFALSGVAYLLAAQTETGGRLPVRFAAVSHQRNPIVAVVHADSAFAVPKDLQGARAARWSMPWFTAEYAGAMAHMGLDPPTIVDRSKDLDTALGRGEIDVIPTWMDMTLHHHRSADFPIRAIPLDIEVYTTGLIAADRLPLDLVARMRDAFVAGYQLQLEQPDLGIAAFRRRFSDVSEQHIRANWALFEPNAFDGGKPGSMDAGRWQTTIEYTAATHGLSVFAGERLYRPALLAPALEYAAYGQGAPDDKRSKSRDAHFTSDRGSTGDGVRALARSGAQRNPDVEPDTVDARAEHLIALVKDGATLTEAARVYGISRERVRQILDEEGMTARDLPGRAQKRGTGSAPPRARALVIEAMWREGMLYHEIAKVLDISCGDVHRHVCARVPATERSAQSSARPEDPRSSDERVVGGLRRAASVLAEAPAMEADDRGHVQALVEGWLAKYELTESPSATPSAESSETADGASPGECVASAELRGELDRFKAELRAGGLRESTIHAYLLGSSLFVRWLAGDYAPGPGRAVRARGRGPEVPQ